MSWINKLAVVLISDKFAFIYTSHGQERSMINSKQCIHLIRIMWNTVIWFVNYKLFQNFVVFSLNRIIICKAIMPIANVLLVWARWVNCRLIQCKLFILSLVFQWVISRLMTCWLFKTSSSVSGVWRAFPFAPPPPSDQTDKCANWVPDHYHTTATTTD